MEPTNNSNNQSKKIIIFGFIMLFVSVIVAYCIFFLKNTIGLSSVNQRSTTAREQSTILEQSSGSLSLSGDELKQGSVVDLDKDLLMFVVGDSVSAKVYEYNDSTGFLVIYTINKNLVDSYKNLLVISRSFPFSIVYASRMSNASIIITESDKYKVKVLQEVVSELQTKVTVSVQKK